MSYLFSDILLNQRAVSVTDIVESKATARTAFEAETFSLIQCWLQKKDEFTLTTSGSTGAPKEITLTRNQLQQSALRTISALGLMKNDTALVCLDTKYIAGKMMLVRALESNMKIIAVEPAADPLQNIQTPVHFAALVPLQLQEIIKNPDSTKKLNQIKAVIVGGASVSNSLQKQLSNLTCAIYATYGMTETVSHIGLQRLSGLQATDLFTVMPGITIETDKRNCLTIRLPESSEKIITNDLVEVAGPGKFRWIGRYDNIINSGGFKISPEKVEKVIEKFLPNQSFFVSAFPDERLGEKLVLIIEGETTGMDFLPLIKNLHPYEIPKEVICMKAFIRTETGKINRQKTRSLAIGQ
ncbi:MAG: AMP-binding protein [Cyclobacteriaceae bacterium]